MEFDNEGKKWYFDNLLYSKLMKIKDVLKKQNNNWTLLIDGPTGSGKTTLGTQIAKIVDPNFGPENMYYNGDDYIKACIDAKPYSVVLYDEAFRDWSSTRAMTAMSHRLNAMMMEIRQKNLFHIIILPSYFDLNKTISIFGSDALIHVHKRKTGHLGAMKYFDSDLKKYLYIKGRKFYNYNCQKPLFKATFGGMMPFSKEEEKKYLQKKKDMLERLKNDQNAPIGMKLKKQLTERAALIDILKMDYHITYEQMAELVNERTGLTVTGSILAKYRREYLDLEPDQTARRKIAAKKGRNFNQNQEDLSND